MNNAADAPAPLLRLDGDSVLEALVADGTLHTEQARALRGELRGLAPRKVLPAIAAHALPDARTPGRILTVEALTQWLAQRSGLPYQRIDPLQIDVARITAVMPYPYAARTCILPIRLTPTELVVAVANPFDREWEADVARLVKQNVQRVVANVEDIERYLVEFYALARSVKSAESERARSPVSGVFYVSRAF